MPSRLTPWPVEGEESKLPEIVFPSPEELGISKNLTTLSIDELHGLVYRCRWNWLAMTESEGVSDEQIGDEWSKSFGDGLEKWGAIQGDSYAELHNRGLANPPANPTFSDELRAHAAYLKLLARLRINEKEEVGDARQYSANFLDGDLTVQFSRHREQSSGRIYFHLAIYGRDRNPDTTKAMAVLEAFFEQPSAISYEEHHYLKYE